MNQKRILSALLILFSLVIVFLFLAQITCERHRALREQHYLGTVLQASAEFDVPPSMVLAVIRTESDFRPNVVSKAGACGLMQLMPETFDFLQKEIFHEDLSDSTIFDPTVNIRYGTFYLSYLFQKFGNWRTALAAYNAGEGRVGNWLKDEQLAPSGMLLHIPFSETAHYVNNVLSAYEAYGQKYQ